MTRDEFHFLSDSSFDEFEYKVTYPLFWRAVLYITKHLRNWAQDEAALRESIRVVSVKPVAPQKPKTPQYTFDARDYSGGYVFMEVDQAQNGEQQPSYEVKFGYVTNGVKFLFGHIEPQNPTNFILNETDPPQYDEQRILCMACGGHHKRSEVCVL